MDHIRVLESFGESRPTTNPYITMLGDSLEQTSGVDLVRFSWRRALTEKFDVFHVHWPEALLDAQTRPKRLGKDLAFLLLLMRIRLRRIAVVQTIHNLELPQGLPFMRRHLITRCRGMTTLRIAINPVTPAPPNVSQNFIPHGHYRDWFATIPRGQQVSGRIAFTGLIRRYKGVENLVDCFRQTKDDHPDLSLTITGKPSSSDLENAIRSAASNDKRLAFSFGYVSEEKLVEAITEAELVVLPYEFMHNSGSALAALSLERPVLVPRNEVNERLSDEVGAGWIYFYDGKLSAQNLTLSLEKLRSCPPLAIPNLSAREWSDAGKLHRDAFRKARQIAKPK